MRVLRRLIPILVYFRDTSLQDTCSSTLGTRTSQVVCAALGHLAAESMLWVPFEHTVHRTLQRSNMLASNTLASELRSIASLFAGSARRLAPDQAHTTEHAEHT